MDGVQFASQLTILTIVGVICACMAGIIPVYTLAVGVACVWSLFAVLSVLSGKGK